MTINILNQYVKHLIAGTTYEPRKGEIKAALLLVETMLKSGDPEAILKLIKNMRSEASEEQLEGSKVAIRRWQTNVNRRLKKRI